MDMTPEKNKEGGQRKEKVQREKDIVYNSGRKGKAKQKCG